MRTTKKKDRQERLMSSEDVYKVVSDREDFWDLVRLAYDRHPEKNPFRRLRLFEAQVRSIIRYCLYQAQMIRDLSQHVESLLSEDTPNSGFPWTDLEDDVLVRQRTEGDSLDKIARRLGRTTQACATRLSSLTGVPREQIVQAFIAGTLDDMPVRGMFHGQVKRFAS